MASFSEMTQFSRFTLQTKQGSLFLRFSQAYSDRLFDTRTTQFSGKGPHYIFDEVDFP